MSNAGREAAALCEHHSCELSDQRYASIVPNTFIRVAFLVSFRLSILGGTLGLRIQ